MSTANPLDELRRRLGNGPAPAAFAALAEEHRRSGRLAEAVSVCREGLERYPTYVSARVTLGRALLDLGDTAGAIGELEQAVEQAPDNLAAARALDAARAALERERGAGPLAAPSDGDAEVEGGEPAPAGAFGSAPFSENAMATPEAADVERADPVEPDPPSLAWLRADPVDTPWELDAAPAAAPGAAPADEGPADEATTAAAMPWDETICAPLAPDAPVASSPETIAPDETTPLVDGGEPERGAAAATPQAVEDAIAHGIEGAIDAAGGEPVDDVVEPAADELVEEAPVAVEAAPADAVADPDPLTAWTGLADAPARTDTGEWDAWVGASLDEVFEQRAGDGLHAPSEDDAEVAPATGVPVATALATDAASGAVAADLAADTEGGPGERAEAVAPGALEAADAVAPSLRTLEALLVSIRERRAALAQRRPGVD